MRATASRMKIAGLDRPSNSGLAASLHDGWLALAAACDVLVLAVPGTPDLKHIIGAHELAALGPKGRLVNVGRGNLVDTAALIEALETGRSPGRRWTYSRMSRLSRTGCRSAECHSDTPYRRTDLGAARARRQDRRGRSAVLPGRLDRASQRRRSTASRDDCLKFRISLRQPAKTAGLKG